MLELTADCSRCFGLCCVALPFARSVDFPTDKDAGDPCRHLRTDFRCGIHARLREEGYRGCTVYDCFGAGQQVAQVTFGGEDWRSHPETARQMFAVLPVMRQVHELLWFLTAALAVPGTEPVHDELRRAVVDTERLTRLDAAALERFDVPAHRAGVNRLLRRASELGRAGTEPPELPADLVGARLAGRDLCGAALRGACLIAADLTGADLRLADLTGADLRDARLHGADLSTALFVSQAQLDAALGDAETRLPASLDRPARWV
jgi:uncharacterized protein YjbI with pentapeptide repeats